MLLTDQQMGRNTAQERPEHSGTDQPHFVTTAWPVTEPEADSVKLNASRKDRAFTYVVKKP